MAIAMLSPSLCLSICLCLCPCFSSSLSPLSKNHSVLSFLLFKSPPSYRSPFHILCFIVVTFPSFNHFLILIITTSPVSDFTIPIKLGLIISLLSVPHIFCLPPVLHCIFLHHCILLHLIIPPV